MNRTVVPTSTNPLGQDLHGALILSVGSLVIFEFLAYCRVLFYFIASLIAIKRLLYDSNLIPIGTSYKSIMKDAGRAHGHATLKFFLRTNLSVSRLPRSSIMAHVKAVR